jgi:hypothetical protein
MAGDRGLGVLLLAAAALLAAAVTAAGDDHMHQWRCFKSCARDCQDEVALGDGAAAEAEAEDGGGVSRRCKTGCLRECFEDLPALCYEQCVVSTCLCLPPCTCTQLINKTHAIAPKLNNNLALFMCCFWYEFLQFFSFVEGDGFLQIARKK